MEKMEKQIVFTNELAGKISESFNEFMNSNKTHPKNVIEEIHLINENKLPKNKVLSAFIKSVYRLSEEF
jgi:hypothetical protein